MNTLTMPLLAAILLLAQDTPTMPHPIAQLLFENAGVIVIAGSTSLALLIRVLVKRLASRQINLARIEAAEAKRKADEIERQNALEKEATQTKIELLRLEVEKNRIEAEAYQQAQKTIQDQLVLLTRQTDLQEKSQETLTDFGRVLSSNSSVLVGNVEEIGELREVVQAHDASSSEQLEQVKTAVNGLITSVDKNHQDIMAAIAVLSDAVEACKRKAGDTGEVVVIPLNADEPPEQKAS